MPHECNLISSDFTFTKRELWEEISCNFSTQRMMVKMRAAVFCWNICILDITLQKTAITFIVMILGSHPETCSLCAVGWATALRGGRLGEGGSIPDGFIGIFINPNPVALWHGSQLGQLTEMRTRVRKANNLTTLMWQLSSNFGHLNLLVP
jgi:hypothetical protein